MPEKIGGNRAPPHGGLQRVSFNGGDTVRRQLPFKAVAVNIDNWSPYWYKLNPIEEYIPPFQHGVNIRLPLIDDYEFVPVAPPGLQQTLLVPTTGIPGNVKPVIAVFSSYDTNNDAGYSALQASANIGNSFISFVGPQSVDIDLTIYDGLYLSLTSSSRFVVEIQYIDSPTSVGTMLYRRIMHINTRLFIVIPKVTRFVRIVFNSDPNRTVVVGGSYSARPFFGSLPFSAKLLPAPNGVVTPQDTVSITGALNTNFTVTGLENALLTILPNGGAGVTLNTVYWVKVFATRLTNVSQMLLYNRAFLGTAIAGNTTNGLILPLNGLLRSQIEQIVVGVVPVEAGVTLATAVTELSMHQGTDQALDISAYDPPVPYTLRGVAVPAGGVFALLTTVPIGGMVSSIEIIVRVAVAGSLLSFFWGTGAAQQIAIGTVPSIAIARFFLPAALPLRTDSGYSTLWVFATAAGIELEWIITIK